MSSRKGQTSVAVRLKSRLAFSGGIVLIGSAVLLWHASAYGNYGTWFSSQHRWTLATSALMVATSFVLNVPDEGNRVLLFLRALTAAATSQGIIAMIQSLTAEQYLPRFVVVLSIVIWPLYSVAFNVILGLVASDDEVKIWTALPIESRERIRHACNSGAVSIRASISEMPTWMYQDSVIPLEEVQLPHMAVYDAHAPADDSFRRNVLILRNRGVRIRSVSDFFEDFLDRVSLDDVELSDLASDVREIHNVPYRRLSRVIDVVTGLSLMALLVVLAPFVWIGNRLGNHGPLLYRQARIGQGGREFRILKFRTMTESTSPSDWTSTKDSRITPFGRVLRLSHLDELPQALNIIRGDLAIVGPRPEQPRYVDLLRHEIPFYDQRHAVRPGLTGWAQVNFPYGASVEDARRKLEFDLYYVRHQSLGLDLRILAHTTRQVLGFRGR